MPGLSKITHKGKEILFIDYDGVKSEDEMIEILKEAQKLIIKENKPYLQLTNIKNAFATPNYMKQAKQVAKDTPKLATKRAIVGIDSPSRKVLLQAYNLVLGKNAIKPFDDLAKAKDYLVS